MLLTATLCAGLLAWADTPPAPPSANDLVSALESALVGSIARAEPSVVAITRLKSEDGSTTAIRGSNPLRPLTLTELNPLRDNEIIFDQGSGVVIGDEGQILVAYHTVRQAARLRVRAFGQQLFEAEIIAADPRSDLAVLAPRATPGGEPPRLQPIALGDAGKLRKGMFVVALGNSFNAARDGSASASWGIVSNIARRIDPGPDEQVRQLRHFPTLLQLDAKLNLGMSGGAVVNLKGELVGLTTNAANVSGYDSLAGYAIPIDALGLRVIEQLKDGKEVEYGFLGIVLDSNGLNRVGQATPASPAAEGGLRTGDDIVGVGDLPVIDADSLVLAVNLQPVGKPVSVKIVRDGQELTKTITLAKYPVPGDVIATNRHTPWRGLRVDYASVLTNNNILLGFERRDAIAQGGVAVVEVREGSPAEAANMKPGQVIIGVNGRPTRTPDEFYKAVTEKDGPVELSTDSGPVTVK